MADAQDAFESGDFATAASQFQILAEQGDVRAQYTLAVMYANGQGVDQDDGQAVRFYRLAADQGHAAAQYDLGLMHANGRGVPTDEMAALGLYRLAADQGHGAAQSNFADISARMLEEGNAAYERADYAAALTIFRSLAELGEAPAQHNLGIMYENGLGVGQDAAEALRWYGLAAEQEFAPAQARLNAP
jgi:TPR repeat protein